MFNPKMNPHMLLQPLTNKYNKSSTSFECQTITLNEYKITQITTMKGYAPKLHACCQVIM
jgi:hypothetical protein